MRLIDADALRKRFDDEVPIRPISQTYNKEDVIRAVLDAPTIGGWVSVKDRLPESDEEVLAAVYTTDDRDAYHVIAVRYPNGDWDSEDEYFCISEDEVRFWMPLPPLPEPPKEVSGDE